MEILEYSVSPEVKKVGIFHDLQTLERLRDLIEHTFRENRDLAYYSRQLNMSPYRLNEITRYYLNQTVYELLQARIHQEAQYLLKNTRYSVKEIAYQIGCSDVAYFCRDFKRRTGKTPKGFRRSAE